MQKLILALVLLFAACTTAPTQPARGFDDQLAYAYADVTAIRLSAAQSLTAGAITSDAATRAQELTDKARSLLDLAKTLRATGDLTGATATLTQATAILVELQKVSQ